MRLNAKWKDVNFIGGHEKERDGGNLRRTAQREFWEEVPEVRSLKNVKFETLSPMLNHGPVFSASAGVEVIYTLQFFLAMFPDSPTVLVERMSAKTRNVWLAETELLDASRYRLSALVGLLSRNLTGGLASIGLSFPANLPYPERGITEREKDQFALLFR